MATPSEWLSNHVKRDHDWLLERLRSLDNCLDNILYFGEVCGDLRGFGGLRLRCQELESTLREHIPEEEAMYARLQSRKDVQPLLDGLMEEHRTLGQTLTQILQTLDALESGEVLPEDLFTLQDKVRALSANLQRHITTENQLVLPLVVPA